MPASVGTRGPAVSGAGSRTRGLAVSLRFALTFNNWYKIEDGSKTFLNWYQFAFVTFNMGIGFVLLVDRPKSRRGS